MADDITLSGTPYFRAQADAQRGLALILSTANEAGHIPFLGAAAVEGKLVEADRIESGEPR